MSNILNIDFVDYHNFTYSPLGIEQNENSLLFEIDDVNRSLIVNKSISNGMAKYENPNQKNVRILDYDGFLSSLPSSFNNGKKRCDVILHTTNDYAYFLLNELKDRIPKTTVRSGAKKQLEHTLTELFNVPTISAYITNFQNKVCCYCNRQPVAPLGINAIGAFNRLSTIAPNGIQLSAPNIEAFGFIFMEYKGAQTFKML